MNILEAEQMDTFIKVEVMEDDEKDIKKENEEIESGSSTMENDLPFSDSRSVKEEEMVVCLSPNEYNMAVKKEEDVNDSDSLNVKTEWEAMEFFQEHGIIQNETFCKNGDISIESATVSNSTTSETLTTHTSKNPWPYIQDFFEFVSSSEDGYRMVFKCVMCLPVSKCYKAQKKSLYSLRSHIASIHGEILPRFNKCVKEGSKEHVRKKRDLSGERDDGDGGPTKKQYKPLNMPRAMTLGASTGRYRNEILEDRIINFFVDNILSLSIVESDSFIQLMECASGKKFSMSQRTLTSKIEEKFMCGVASLKVNLEEPLYVATTTDAWSCWNKSYLGVTVHWIDPYTLLRKKGIIACRRLKGKHTFNVLAKEIEDVHIQFGIQDKTCATTTDNGSNFVKGFRLFGESDRKCSQSQATARLAINSDSEEEDDVDVDETVIEDVTAILDQGLQSSELGEYYALPKHVRCAAHTLNLVATIDAAEVMNKDYKKVSRSAFSKAQALWNKQARSPQAADVIKEELDGQPFIIPGATRWNSLYDAVCHFNKVLRSKENAIKRVCNTLGLPSFAPIEVTYLKEYEAVMNPIARALDVLQGEDKAYMGILLPTITVCIKLLIDVKAKNLSVCGPLATVVESAIRNRFGEMLEDDECLLASASHPHFKLKWLNDPEKADYITRKMSDEIKNLGDVTVSESSGAEGETIEAEDDFFRSLSKLEGRVARKKDTANEVKEWLQQPVASRFQSPAVHSAMFPSNTYLSCFIKHNTAIPSSAAVERLFLLGKEILRPKSALLSDKHFEMLTFLKGNQIPRSLMS